MKTTTFFAFVSMALSYPSAAYAGTIFGSGSNTFEIEFVTIGDPIKPRDSQEQPE